MIDTDIINNFCCPIGKEPLKANANSFLCTKCGVIFPVRDGIPSFMVESAILPQGIKTIDELPCMKESKPQKE
jgi:uncharacterized protein YbaR (Trm112 family)